MKEHKDFETSWQQGLMKQGEEKDDTEEQMTIPDLSDTICAILNAGLFKVAQI